MIPYFSFLNYKDSDYQQDNGYISNIQVNGDNQPLTVMVSGPNGYTAGPFVTPSVIPTLNNLEPGTYILNVTNAIGENSTLEIIIAELPETVLVSDFGDPCNCSDCNCTLSILSYTHNSDCFTYNLYKDGVIIDTYTGCTGSEIHTFTDLCNGQYTVEAVENDVLVHTYSNSGGCEEGSISFDETSDPAIITSNWTRFCFFAPPNIYDGSTNIPSGLDPNTGIISNAPGTYFERGNSYDLGDHNIPMTEGQDIGPISANDPSAQRKYYYNTAINKYIVSSDVQGVGFLSWVTFDPREDEGITIGNPTAAQVLTSTSNWNTVPLTSNQFTIDNSNNVVLASTKLTSFPSMVQCALNSALVNGFYSICNFDNFTHEVTIGSTNADNDFIGIVIAAIKDVNGIHGLINQTYTLSLHFNSSSGLVALRYNYGSETYAFTDGVSFTSILASAPSPFAIGGYNLAGNVRVKIVKTGNIITVSTTNSMGDTSGIQTNASVNVGGSNPYNAPLFTIDLTDKNTWTHAPVYATGSELLKFVNQVKIGYLTASQPLTQFFDIKFDGELVNTSSEVEDAPGATTELPFRGCPCYIATNCEDPNEQILVTLDEGTFDLNLVYQFEAYPGKCWTVQRAEDCNQQTIILNTGLNAENTAIGSYNDPDGKWEVIAVPPAGVPVMPFPARISNQSWYPGYGSIPGAAWITKGGNPNGSGNLPHDTTQGLTVYKLDFNIPLSFIPLLNLQILTDNTAKIYLNGTLIFDNSLAPTPWVTPSTLTVATGFSLGLNTLIVEVTNVGTGSNGFALAGSISTGNPPSEVVIVSDSFDNCDECVNPVIPNICYDLEVVCGGNCPDIFGINSFDFSPYIGQNISIQPPLSTNPECWYRPYAIRQAVFVNLNTHNFSWPFGSFQAGTNNITFSCTSLILNNTEYISGTPPSVTMTPLTYNPVQCTGLTCVAVSPNTTENSFTNIPDFLNTLFAANSINTIQAFSNDPNNCPICPDKADLVCEQTLRIQYRDGDTFQIVLHLTNNAGTRIVTLTVANGNITTQTSSLLGTQEVITYDTCNDNIYCGLTDESYDITGVTVEGDCPPPDLGQACEITPRLGEPGFSVKNCDPKKVIDIKTKFADAVYAWFKRTKYGINTCCEFDLDKIDIKNQMIDLGFKYDPDMCVNKEIIPDCCPQPCNAVITILIPESISCPAPIDSDATIEIEEIVIPCDPPTPLSGSAVRARINIG